jgi:hypothetical protein
VKIRLICTVLLSCLLACSRPVLAQSLQELGLPKNPLPAGVYFHESVVGDLSCGEIEKKFGSLGEADPQLVIFVSNSGRVMKDTSNSCIIHSFFRNNENSFLDFRCNHDDDRSNFSFHYRVVQQRYKIRIYGQTKLHSFKYCPYSRNQQFGEMGFSKEEPKNRVQIFDECLEYLNATECADRWKRRYGVIDISSRIGTRDAIFNIETATKEMQRRLNDVNFHPIGSLTHNLIANAYVRLRTTCRQRQTSRQSNEADENLALCRLNETAKILERVVSIKKGPPPPCEANDRACRRREISRLLDEAVEANANCRGLYSDDPRQLPACERRQQVFLALFEYNYCRGRTNESGYQHQWHVCGKNSYTPNLERWLPDYGR